jgi:hypothetical protein
MHAPAENPAVAVRARMARPSDAEAVADLLCIACPPLVVLGTRLADLIARLIAGEAIRCGVIEQADPSGRWMAGASGASIFVADAVADQLLAADRPFGAAMVLERLAAGETGLALGPAEIARANAEAGLNLFVIGFSHAQRADSPALRILLARAIEHFVAAHRGYRLKRVLREDDAPIAEILIQSGMRPVRSFGPEETGGMPRRLMLREATDAMPLFPDSITAQLFAFSPPVILFPAAERRMLEQALNGLSDEELAAELGLSINTVKRMWKSVYARSAERAPHVMLSDPGHGPAERRVRGAEKRRHLLLYIREHPEELRPYGVRPF